MPVYGITNRNISNLYGIEFLNGVCNVLTRVARDHNMKLDMVENTTYLDCMNLGVCVWLKFIHIYIRYRIDMKKVSIWAIMLKIVNIW